MKVRRICKVTHGGPSITSCGLGKNLETIFWRTTELTGNLSDSFPVTENGGNGTADICELHGVPVLFLKTVAVDTTILSFYK